MRIHFLLKRHRPPPFLLKDEHEVTPALDVDWTLCPEDWAKEIRLRHLRNCMIKEALLEGHSIKYRSSGSSLWPKVKCGDECTYAPVTEAHEIEEWDIVFCEVQPGDRFYAHMIKAKYWDTKAKCWYFNISMMDGKENGWCAIKHIYGRLVKVNGVKP